MTKEQQPISIDQLEENQRRISSSLEKIEAIENTVGEKMAKSWLESLSGIEYLEKAAKLSNAVPKIIKRLEEKAKPTLIEQREETESKISQLRIEIARKTAEESFEKIRQAVREGYLPVSVLQKAEIIYDEKYPKSPEEKAQKVEAVLPQMIINLDSGEVEVDGRSLIITGPIDSKTLAYLAQKANQNVPFEEINEIARQAGSKTKFSSGNAIHTLRRKLEIDPKNPILITRLGPKNNPSYRLNAQVEFTSQRYEESKQPFEVELPDGQKITTQGKIHLKAAQRLVETSFEFPVGSDDLSQYIYGQESEIYLRRLHTVLESLKKILRPHEWDIVQKSARIGGRRKQKEEYYLKKTSEEKVKPKEVPPAPHPTRTKTLENLLENTQISTQEIVKQLGKSRRRQELTWIQAYYALRKATNLIDIRSRKGIASTEETKVLGEIQRFIQEQELGDLVGFKEWLKLKLAPTTTEAEEIETTLPLAFTPEEAAILATEINMRGLVIQKYQIPLVPQEILKELVKQMPEKLEIPEEELIEKRHQALDKMIKIVNEELIDEVYDQQESEAVKDFLIYFLDLDPPKTYGLLQELLEIPVERFHQQDSSCQVIRVWQELRFPPKNAVEAPVETPQKEVVAEPAKATVEEAEIAGVAEEPKPITEETKQPKAKKEKGKKEGLTGEERQFFNQYLEQLKQNKVKEPIKASQLTRIFPVLKMNVIKKMLEKRYINPDFDGTGHPVYNQAEILTMLYVLKKDNNFTSQEVRKLKQKLQDWLDKKNQSR